MAGRGRCRTPPAALYWANAETIIRSRQCCASRLQSCWRCWPSGPAVSAERAVVRHGRASHGRYSARRIAAAALQIPNHYFVWPAVLISKALSFVRSMAMNPRSCSRLHTPKSPTSRLERQPLASGYSDSAGLLWLALFLRLSGPLLRRSLCQLLGTPALRLRRLRLLLRDCTTSRCASPPCFRALAGCRAEALNR